MALSNALFAGLSGLNVNQVKLNVVSNNIANVNTVGFKSTRVLFKPQFYVTDSGGTQPTADFGGTNPSQRGLGAVVAGLDRNLTPGSIENTGNATDLAMDGEGYFIVKSNEQKFTRDGSFSLNATDQLVTGSGEFVQGFGVDGNFNVISGQLGSITIPLGSLTTAEATTKVGLQGNLNTGGSVAEGASVLTTQLLTTVGGAAAPTQATLLTNVSSTIANGTALFAVGDTYTLDGKKGVSSSEVRQGSFIVGAGSTLGDLMTFYQDTLGINTSVPDDGNAATPTAGVTVETDGADPNSVRMVVTGNLGAENALALQKESFRSGTDYPFTFAEDATRNKPTGESTHGEVTAYDSLGNAVKLGITGVFESKANAGNLWRFYVESADATVGNRAVATGTLLFDGQGQLMSSTGTDITIPRDDTGAITPLSIELDFKQTNGFSDQKSEWSKLEVNGSAIGTLTSFSIGANGIITGNFSNNVHRTLGQVAVATFSNPQGLVDRGGNMFMQGPNSGPAVIGAAGSLGAGKIQSGSLELSNVDLSEEFVNLILASTGFSASSRVISMSDRLIQELLNTSR